MQKTQENIPTGQSRVVLQFGVQHQNNTIGIMVGSDMRMPIMQKNFEEAFKTEEVNRAFSAISRALIELFELEKNKEEIIKVIDTNTVNKMAFPLVTLNMLQTMNEDKGGIQITPFFDIKHENALKITNEQRCIAFKGFLEQNKDLLQPGCFRVIDAVMNAIREYNQSKAEEAAVTN